MTIHQKGNISYLTFPALDELGIVHGIFMRHGGVSSPPWKSLNLATSVGDSREHVIENRRRVTNTLRLADDSIYDVWQVHSNTISYSHEPRSLDTPHLKADAVVTDKPDVTLMMLFADCVPILFFDYEREISAIAHAGWQGTVNHVAAETIRTLVANHACNVENIIACIGPAICADHYQVGDNVVEAINKSFANPEEIIRTREGKFHADLQIANEILIRNLGVKKVYQSRICTAENTQDWFSHRAENGQAGRFAAVMTCQIKQ